MTKDQVRALIAALDRIGDQQERIGNMLSMIEDRLHDHQNLMYELTYTEADDREKRVLRVSS